MDQVHYEAHWFLPSDPQTRIPGHLNVDRGGAELRLYGLFEGSLQSLVDFNRQHQFVRGLTLGGTPITLVDCTLLNANLSSSHGGVPVSVWHASQVLVGGFVEGNDLTFRAVKAQFSLLDSFMVSTGLSLTMYDEQLRTLISYQRRRSAEFEVASAGIRVQEDVDLPAVAAPTTTMTISTRKVVIFRRENPTDMSVFMSSIHHFRALLTILIGFESRVVAVWCRIDDRADEVPYRWVRFYAEVNQSDQGSDGLHPSKLRSRISDMGRPFGDVIRDWYAVERRIDLVRSYYLSGYYQSQFMDQRLVAVTTALEMYYREFCKQTSSAKPVEDPMLSTILSKLADHEADWLEKKLASKNHISLRDKLEHLFGPHAELLGVQPDVVSGRVRDLVEYRNAFSHGRAPNPRGSTPPHELLEFARLLLETCIRTEILHVAPGAELAHKESKKDVTGE
jgi:hypothetical protein